MNWLYYLGEANLYLAVFYLAYRLFLVNETYNQLSRVYLLFSCIAAFVLPVLQVGALKPVEAPVIVPAYSTGLVYPIHTTAPVVAQVTLPAVAEHHLTWQDYLLYAYAIGCGILLLTLLVKLFVLIRMIGNAKRERMDKYKLIYLPESDVAFSFFNYLFIGTDATGADTIIRHELVHINQKHSLDILLVELLKIVNWFNPFIYLLQNSLKTIHEYIADEHTAAYENDAIGYSAFLVNNAYGAGSSITHSFFNYNLLKKRIIMLNQKRSGSSARLKYLVALPVFAGLLCASTLAFSKDYGWIDLDPAKPLTLSPTPVASRTVATTTYKNSYKKLNDHLVAHIQFDKTINRWSESAEVITSFNVTSDHKIADARIIKSGGKAFDAIVMRGFNTYHGNVTDKAGTRKFVFNFVGYGGDRNKALASFGHDNVVGSLVIVPPVVKFPPPIIKSGDKFEYTDKNGGHVITARLNHVSFALKPDGSNYPIPVIFIDNRRYYFTKDQQDQINAGAPVNVSADSTITYQPNNPYALSKWGDLAKNKIMLLYGHGSVEVVSPKPAPIPDYHISRDSMLNRDEQFDKELMLKVHYPAIARENNLSGQICCMFSVDDKGNLQYFKILNSFSNSASEEVLRVLKNSPLLKKMPGGWMTWINFVLNDGDNNVQKNVSAATPPKSETDIKTFEYNPNNIKVSGFDVIQSPPIIRGYAARPKN